MYVRLSYNLTECRPAADRPYPEFTIEPLTETGRGAFSNTFRVSFTNHQGTHLDAPYHYNPRGKRVTDFSISEYIFDRPVVVDVEKGDDEFICPSDLDNAADRIAECDLLMLRTGFCRYRTADPERYARRNPGISSEAAQYLMQGFPNLRALAIDAVSIEFEGNYDHGFAAHKVFLCDDTHPVILIEGVNMDLDLSHLVRVFVIPLYIEQLDGCPCTVIGEVQPCDGAAGTENSIRARPRILPSRDR